MKKVKLDLSRPVTMWWDMSNIIDHTIMTQRIDIRISEVEAYEDDKARLGTQLHVADR